MDLSSGSNNHNRKENTVIRAMDKIFENPIVGSDLLDIPSYEIEFIEGAEEYPHLDTMDLRHIESGASIRFYSKRSNEDIVLPVAKIKDLKIIKQSDGGFFRNEELTLKIEFESEYGDKIILINSNDKNISDLIPQVNLIQKRLYDKLWWTNSNIYLRTERNEFTSVHIFPMIPFLSSGESIVWNNIQTKGVVNKKIIQLDLVTNYRVYQYDFDAHMGNYVLISGIEDVIVSNQRRLSDSNRYGNYVRSSYTITGHGNTKTTSQTVGDVSILTNGRPYVLFREVSDPNGLARMIKSMKKQCNFTIEPPAVQNKESIIDISESESQIENKALEVENSNCIFCGQKNLPNSKFCNYCGQSIPISNKCRTCNHLNTNDALFCNQCGNNLKTKR